MGLTRLRRVAVAHPGHVDQARRLAAQLALQVDLPTRAEWQLVVAELGHNLVQHAGFGELLLGIDEDEATLTVVSLDWGPGIADIDRAFVDGYSTRPGHQLGSRGGIGLGAVRRLSETLGLWSAVDSGTAIVARLGRERGADPAALIAPARHRARPADHLAMVSTARGTRIAMRRSNGGHGETNELLASSVDLELEVVARNLSLASDGEPSLVAELDDRGTGVMLCSGGGYQLWVDGRPIPLEPGVPAAFAWRDVVLSSAKLRSPVPPEGIPVRRAVVGLWGAEGTEDVGIVVASRPSSAALESR